MTEMKEVMISEDQTDRYCLVVYAQYGLASPRLGESKGLRAH